jgi:cephalosporin-C deacetylase-like acetyl esterase
VALILSVHDLPFGGESGRHHPKELWSETPYQAEGLESKETYFYRHAYLAPVRAFDFLRTLPMVDPDRIMVAGGSQGGSMTLAAAALEPRFAFASASIPGRVRFDLLNTGYRANGTFNPPAGMTVDRMIDQTLVYFDIAYFARRIRVPTWVDMSLNDPINPGPLQMIAYRNLTQVPEKGFTLGMWQGHGEIEDESGDKACMLKTYMGSED